jgi:hypothetical protein
MSKYNQDEKLLPILGSVDIVATATATQFVDLNLAVGTVQIDLNFGLISSTDSTGEAVVTLVADTVGDTSSSDSVETALAFKYRVSAAVASDSMGEITDATAAGVAVLNTTDNAILSIFVEPEAVAAAAPGARFVRAVVTPTGEVTSTVVGAVARFKPRYPGNNIPSST